MLHLDTIDFLIISSHFIRTGTVTILEDTATRITSPADRDPSLRYDKTGEILLVPQPSNDPNE